MNVSARNKIKGKVKSINEGAVNAIVVITTDAGDNISSTISLDAVKALGLSAGKEVYAVIKATEVMIGLGDFTLSARNQIEGTVSAIKEGAVNAIVTLTTANGTAISSTISMDAVKSLGLSSGMKAKAVVKSTSVMIGL